MVKDFPFLFDSIRVEGNGDRSLVGFSCYKEKNKKECFRVIMFEIFLTAKVLTVFLFSGSYIYKFFFFHTSIISFPFRSCIDNFIIDQMRKKKSRGEEKKNLNPDEMLKKKIFIKV